jgi:hypothetical protein
MFLTMNYGGRYVRVSGLMVKMMLPPRMALPLLLWLAASSLPLQVDSPNAQKDQVGDTVSMGVINLMLYNAATKATTQLPMKSARLGKVRVTVPAGKYVPTIQQLLLEQLIHPNMDAVALVYEWNPDVTSLRMLTPKQVLWLPSAESLSSSAFVFSKELRLEIELDAPMKEQLKQTTAMLSTIAQSDTPPAIVTFKTTDSKSQAWNHFKSAVDQLGKISSVVVEKTRPISHRMLEQVVAQAHLLLRLATSNDLGKLEGPITEAQRMQYIDKDLTIRASTLIDIKSAGAIADSNQKITVTVNVFKQSDFTTPLSGYRVYYVGAYEFGIAKPKSFGKLTPPIIGPLEPGFYTIWATKEGEPSSVLHTKPWTNTVDDSLIGPIDLQLMQG